jgi:hypothetical protein
MFNYSSVSIVKEKKLMGMAGHKQRRPMLTSSDVVHLFNVFHTVKCWVEQGIIIALCVINGKPAVMQAILAFIHQNGGSEKGVKPAHSIIAIDKGEII